MGRINRKIEYALMALKHMLSKVPGELTTANEVCLQYSAPFDATSRVMQVMAQSGILRSEQGKNGGYYIARNLDKVSLFDLYETVLGPVELAKCLSVDADDVCDMMGSCNIISPIQILNRRINDFYGTVFLGELLSGKAQASGKPKMRENGAIV